jgi:capsular exopolysaccharide synthesis family protein
VDGLLTARRVPDEVLQTEIGMLGSAALAGRVVDTLNLAADPTFNPPSEGLGSSSEDADQRQVLVNRLRKHLTVDPQQGRLVAVSYDAPDRALAAKVVNGVLDSYIQWRLEDATNTAKWLSAQIAQAQKELEASERRLQAHVRRNGLQIIETGKGESTNLVNDRLRQLQSQLAEVQVDRYQKQSAYENAATATHVIDDPVIQNLTMRLADLQREYASLSSTFLEDYPKVQQVKQQISQVQASLDAEVRIGRKRLESGYQAALRREALLQGALAAQQKTAMSLTGDMAGYESLKREVQTNQQLYTALDQKLKDVTISGALRATNMGIVDRASTLAAAALNFPIGVTLSLAACVGLLLSLGLVFVQEQSDRSVRSMTQVDAHLGFPALAVIPAIDGQTRFGRSARHVVVGPAALPPADGPQPGRLDAADRSRAALTEAFAALRTSVMLNNGEAPPRSLLITSASAGEGKTTVAVNLALSLARLNERVLLVDFDLRRPSVSRALNLESGLGLSDCLLGGAAWRECRRTGPVGSLDVLTAGTASAGEPAEMALSPRLRQLLTEAEDEYDFVILDSAPVLIYPADVRTLAALVDGTLLTVRSGFTSREAVREAWMQLRRPLGIVLNGASPRDTSAYAYPDC